MSQGLDIAECAEAIFIRARYLAAIEDGRFEDLPDPAYVGGFVRAYADYLGVDLDGFAEPDRDLPVRSAPDRRSQPVYLSVTRTHARGGRRVAWLVWSLIILVALALLVLLALWLGVLDDPGATSGL
jgi:cytoskeleton protein RodZ